MNIVAIIPARSKSKGIKNKNIRIFNGKPLLSYSIEQAKSSKLIDRVIVSTDSIEYANIAEKYGAEVPFLRPSEISGDTSLDIEVFLHAAEWLQKNENYEADFFVHLRPTHPIRNVEDIEEMLKIIIKDKKADSIRSVSPSVFTPYKMWFINNDGQLDPVIKNTNIPEPYNEPRQKLPKTYSQNACIDIIRGTTITQKNSMTGDKILGYVMNYDYDIDDEEDFLRAEKEHFIRTIEKTNKKFKLVFDIDGIIAQKTPHNNYELATPIMENIDIINKLHKMGHTIVLFTARGYVTGIDWGKVTREQMNRWQVKYDELFFGKPDADFYIDDKYIDMSILKKHAINNSNKKLLI